MSPNDSLQFDPFPAIKKLSRLFKLPELANRTIEGGWELVFRNQLLRELQKLLMVKRGNYLFDREALVVRGKVADIAILNASDDAKSPDRNHPQAIFEIKHNFATQREVFIELKGAMDKWKRWRKDKSCEFHYIQIVTDIRRLAGAECKSCCIYPSNNKERKGRTCNGFCSSVCAEVFKYKIQPDKGMREDRMEEINEHFKLLQKCADPNLQRCRGLDFKLGLRVKTFPVASEKYFLRDICYKADVHVFLVSQRAATKRTKAGLLFEDATFPKQIQTALLDFSKGGKARAVPNRCAELR